MFWHISRSGVGIIRLRNALRSEWESGRRPNRPSHTTIFHTVIYYRIVSLAKYRTYLRMVEEYTTLRNAEPSLTSGILSAVIKEGLHLVKYVG